MTTVTTTEYFTIDGLKLSVKIAGKGRPFLFLHGLCGDALQPLELFPDCLLYTSPSPRDLH